MSRIIGFFSEKSTDTGEDLTTKGDLHGYSTENTRIAIGSNDEVLTADSSEALGLKWAATSGLSSPLTSDLVINDNVNLKFGTDSDCTLDFNGTDLVLNIMITAHRRLLLSGLTVWGEDSNNTISSGSITPYANMVSIDTEGAASSDDCDTIVLETDGTQIFCHSATATRDVTMVDGTNLKLAGNFTMTTPEDSMLIVRADTLVKEVSRSDNG